MLTKMGLMGIQLKIALKNEMPKEFEMIDSAPSDKTTEVQKLENTTGMLQLKTKKLLKRMNL